MLHDRVKTQDEGSDVIDDTPSRRKRRPDDRRLDDAFLFASGRGFLAATRLYFYRRGFSDWAFFMVFLSPAYAFCIRFLQTIFDPTRFLSIKAFLTETLFVH